jgi:uncharacterized protein (TIGR00288 family)
LSPWWLRPTAEGLNEENREKKEETSPASPEPFTPPTPIAEEPPISQGTEPAPEPDWRENVDEPLPGPELPLFFDEAAQFEAPLADEDLPFEAAEEDREEAGEVELADGGQEGQEEKPESRRKRPRRSRRRGKNGRTATPAAETAPEAGDEDEDDEDEETPLAEEPVFEEPLRTRRRHAPAPHMPPPSPVQMVSVPAVTPRAYRATETISLPPDEPLPREIIVSLADRQRTGPDERKIAMFCDLENIALGVRDSEISKFDMNLILERLLEKGKIIVKKAYADWERYSEYKRTFHEAAIELIDIPQKFYSGKNSADIKMVVDAMDLSYSKEHLDTFVIVSGDSDFSPLVSKLKENNKYVIGIGVKNSSSNLLIDNCDEFIYYEDVWRDNQKGPKLDGLNKKTAEAFSLMIESIQALIRENKDVLWGSMIKQTMQRKKPSFNEGYYGYSSFSELLEDAARKNIIKLKKDQRSGTYIVTGFAKSSEAVAATASARR